MAGTPTTGLGGYRLTRDPSLPVGNSTQRYRVVGYSQGNVIEVSAHPWMNIQGGDFDGDDACIQQVTLELFPNPGHETENRLLKSCWPAAQDCVASSQLPVPSYPDLRPTSPLVFEPRRPRAAPSSPVPPRAVGGPLA